MQPGQVPGLAVIMTFVLALASIAVLVMYVHHVGQALRISALVELAGGQTRGCRQGLPERGHHPRRSADPAIILAGKSGCRDGRSAQPS